MSFIFAREFFGLKVALRGMVAAWAVLCGMATVAAEYTSPGLGSRITDPSDLKLENINILSESTLANGRTLLEIGASVRNLDTGLWDNVVANVNDTIASGVYDYFGTSIRYEFPVNVGELATNSEVINLVVNAGDVSAATSEVLAGTVLTVTANSVSGAIVDTAAELPLENIQIVGQEMLSGGRELLQIGAAVRNQTTNVLTNIVVNFLNTRSALTYIVPGSAIEFGSLTGNASGATVQPLYLDVSSAEAASVRTNVLSGAGLKLIGTERWVFAAPPRGVDQATEEAWRWPAESAGAELQLVFTNVTTLLQTLQVGDLLLEDPSLNRLALEAIDNPADPFDDDRSVLADYLPFQVSSVTIVSNEVRVVGQKKLLTEILESATLVAYARDAYDRPVREPYDPTLENTYTKDEQKDREEVAKQVRHEDSRDGRLADLDGLVALPWHFNATNLIDRVKISGEMFFRQSGLKFELKIRNFQLQRMVTRIDAGVVLNMLIEVEGKKPEGEEPKTGSKNLLPIDPLPAVTFNLGGVPVTVQPELSLTTGIEENVPLSLSLPLQSSFLVGMEMGYDRSRKTGTNDGFFYEPFVEAHPIRVSDPTVFDDLELSLKAWAELGLGLKIGVGEGLALRAGPSLAIRLNNEFKLAPLSNPWWEVDSGVDLIGQFKMEADFLGLKSVELTDLEANLQHFTIFHHDAGGPLIRGLKAMDAEAAGAGPILGKNTRWARMFQPGPGFGFRKAFAFAVPGAANEVIVGGSGGVSDANSTIAKFGRNGELIWMKDTFPIGGAILKRGAVLPDGTFFAAGIRGFDLVVSRFDANGNGIWSSSYRPSPSIAVMDVAATTNRTGQAEFYVTGYQANQSVRETDPVLIKFDGTGGIVWAFSYGLEGGDQSHGITLSADGNPILCGYTSADVAPSPYGTPDSDNILKNAVSSGLLMKVDAGTGSILWAQAYASRWGISFESVVEAPDGTIYTAGGASKIVTQTRPSNMFAKFASDGSLLNHVLVGDDPDWVDELPNGGNSPYDTVTSLIWTPEGLFACGNTGLGLGTAGWVMGLTEEFGVKFYSIFDGDKSEALFSVVDAGDGLAVLGNTQSAKPLGQGGETIGFLMKLPWEGILRFHEDTGLRSLFLQPRIYDSAGTEEFQILSHLKIPNVPPIQFANSFSSVSFSNTPILITLSGAVDPLKPSTNLFVMALERLDSAGVHDFASWAAYHRLPPGTDPKGDSDGDGSPNILESYFGQNPWAPDTVSPFSLSSLVTNNQQNAVIEFQRQRFAQNLDVDFESSENLQNWSRVQAVAEVTSPLGPGDDWVRLTIPVSARMQYFRAVTALQ